MSNYRKIISSSLEVLTGCPSCTPPAIACGEGVNPPSGTQGLYNLTFNSGDTAGDVGAIIIYFNPQNVPDGLRVLYDGTYYNSVSAPTYGRIQSTSGVTGAFTLLGFSNECVPELPNTTTYNYFDGFTGNTWVAGNPSTQDVTLNVGDDAYGGAAEYSTMVIPKTDSSITDVTVQVLGPCSGTAWNIEVDCPTDLPAFTSSSNQGSSLACATVDQTFYFANHRGTTNTKPVLTSWVFSDTNGATVLTNGNYVISGNEVITVLSGVVTNLNSSCTSSSGHLISESENTTSQACSLPQNSTTSAYSSDFMIGSIVYSDSGLNTSFVGDGNWYHISDFHSVYQINSSGEILDIFDCFE